jgi:hypothetical protein
MTRTTNKSEKIRALRKKNPSIRVAEIVAQMEKEGTPVSAPLVYQALKGTGVPKKRGPKARVATSKTMGTKRGPKPGVAKATVATTTPSSNEDLFAAMQTFVNAAGSLEKAIEILSVFKR